MTDPTPIDPAAAAPADPTLFDLPGSTDPALDDQAAEIDDVPPLTVGDDGYTGSEPTFSGVCQGGPYNGRTVSIRYPGGFLLYDKANQMLWTYDARNPGEFVATGGGPLPTGSDDGLRLAADGLQYDVLAYDTGPAVTS